MVERSAKGVIAPSALLSLAVCYVSLFTIHPSQSFTVRVSFPTYTTTTTTLFSSSDVPSDYDPGDVVDTAAKVFTSVDNPNESDERIRDELKRELLLLSTVTNRGECATPEERDIIVDLVTQLEALNPTAHPLDPESCDGEWDLVLSSTQFFRSSPFFLAVRAALADSPGVAATGFDLHDRATSAGRIGRVRQTIAAGELVSEVDLSVGLTPGLPVVVKGTVVTTADVDVVSPETMEVRIRSTRVNRSNVPFLNQVLDDATFLELPMGDIFQTLTGSPSVAVLKTYYMDQGMRITRDEDDNFFVYARA